MHIFKILNNLKYNLCMSVHPHPHPHPHKHTEYKKIKKCLFKKKQHK